MILIAAINQETHMRVVVYGCNSQCPYWLYCKSIVLLGPRNDHEIIDLPCETGKVVVHELQLNLI